MDGLERRNHIMSLLEKNMSPTTGTHLAKLLEVSRQVIVQDVALLRAQGYEIISTSEGYLVYKIKKDTLKRVLCVTHSDEAIEEELYLIVDNGGMVLNVIVSHKVYGEISVDLHLGSRRQVDDFISKTKTKSFVPLMSLTNGAHFHTIEAESEEILDNIENDLRIKGYLVEN
jgi:transcriptional regulator of NAD metabolism